MIQAYIYILHLNEPIAHAQHYAGCTRNIKTRLRRHALGTGGNLVRVAMDRGIGWRLGGLSICTHAQMRRLEKQLKDQANGPRYCGICTESPTRLEGTTPLDLSIFQDQSWTKSERYKPISEADPFIDIGILNPHKIEAETLQIQRLMHSDKDALGFVPAGGTEGIATLIESNQLIVARDKELVVGYTFWTLNAERSRAKIHQCCVHDDYRLGGIGTQLIEMVERLTGRITMECAVRSDLAANHFWPTVGFEIHDQFKHKTSGNTLNLFRKKGANQL